MSRLAYLDLASGIAGDMAMAALVSAGHRAGVDVEGRVAQAVEGLDLGATVSFEDTKRGSLACVVAHVDHPPATHTPDELREALGHTKASDRARTRALASLDALVGAEARVHGVEPSDVHLHELGSPDTAADLIGAAVGFDALGVTTVAAAPVPAPRGFADGSHGTLPLPAPVTLELLRGAPMHGVERWTELVTPTGAAILVGHGCVFGPMPPMTLEEVGVGGGTRELEQPNVCRVLLGRAEATVATQGGPAVPWSGLRLERTVLLETNIDDLTPEAVGRAVEALLAAGALDAWVTPIVMKKSRPAFLLGVLVDHRTETRVLDVLFRETTTLGIRRRDIDRWTLPREEVRVIIRGTNVRVKVARLGGEPVTVSPEYEDCLTVADRDGVPFKDVYAEATTKARRIVEG